MIVAPMSWLAISMVAVGGALGVGLMIGRKQSYRVIQHRDLTILFLQTELKACRTTIELMQREQVATRIGEHVRGARGVTGLA